MPSVSRTTPGSRLVDQARRVLRRHPGPTVFAGTVLFGTATFVTHRVYSSWRATQWLFDYSHGVVRRGLLGEVLGTVTRAEFELGSMLVSIAVVIAVAALITVAVTRGGTLDRRRLALAVAAVGAAGGFPFIAASTGRLEQVVLLLALPSAVAVWRRPAAGGAIAAATGVAAAFVHEAAIVLFWPWLAALHWHRHRSFTGAAAVIGAPGAAVLVLLVVSSGAPDVPPEVLLTELARGTDIDPSASSVAVLYRGLGDNLAATAGFLTSRELLKLPMSILAAAPLLVYALWAAWPQWRDHLVLLVGSLAPLSLGVVAYDYGRWFAVASVLTSVSAMVIGTERRRTHLAYGAVGVLLATIASGPTDDWGFEAVTAQLLRVLPAIG